MDTKALSIPSGLAAKVRSPPGAEVQREAHRDLGLRRPLPGSQRCRVAHALQYANSAMEAAAAGEMPRVNQTVGDVMTTALISVTQDTPVTDALGLVVKHRITGVPVVDDDNVVVGVVSDYDLMALDLSSTNQGMFPSLDVSWQTFRQTQALMRKSEGQTVEDVMTDEPVTVQPQTSLDMAARILMESKIRRLPVVDVEGKLVGLLSRRNIFVAGLAERSGNGSVVLNNMLAHLA